MVQAHIIFTELMAYLDSEIIPKPYSWGTSMKGFITKIKPLTIITKVQNFQTHHLTGKAHNTEAIIHTAAYKIKIALLIFSALCCRDPSFPVFKLLFCKFHTNKKLTLI